MKTSTLFRAQIKARSRFHLALVDKDGIKAERYSRLVDKLDLEILKRLKMEEAVREAVNDLSHRITKCLLDREEAHEAL